MGEQLEDGTAVAASQPVAVVLESLQQEGRGVVYGLFHRISDRTYGRLIWHMMTI